MTPPCSIITPTDTSPQQARSVAAIVWLLCSALIGIAVQLSASPQGYGTHQQLGIAACSWRLNDLACPTCGMTTAFTHTMQGRLLNAIQAQPAGTLFAVSTGVFWWLALWILITGSTALHFRWLWQKKTIRRLLLAVALSWGYKLMVVGS